MEPSQPVPAGDAPESAPSPAGELVVQNGRQSGMRRALSIPLTLIGRAPGCDIRLNAKGVGLLHCALVHGPSGLIVRSLQAECPTLVNGEAAASRPLEEGDLLSVGPFHFRVRLPRINGALDVEALWHEKEALRIQAAAVAAQQAELTEEESRLQQKRTALQKQEEQIAAHLEEKRRQLVELRDQVRDARAALRRERAAHARHTAEVDEDQERTRRANAGAHQRVQARRQRLLQLVRGLKRRRLRQQAEDAALLRRRQQQIDAAHRELEAWQERLHQQKAALAQERLCFNGEVELGRRQIQDSWQQLVVERKQWERTAAEQQAQLHDRWLVLEQQAADLAQLEHDLNRRTRQWDEKRSRMEREVEGLENRIRNQRRLLAAPPGAAPVIETPQAALPAPFSTTPVGPCPPMPAAPPSHGEPIPCTEEQQRLAILEGLAGELVDQRLHLAEQFERLLRAQQHWQSDRELVAADLEAAGRRLEEREQALDQREQALAPSERVLAHRREEAMQLRSHLEAWRARFAAREAAWEAERERLLADLAGREKLVEQQQQMLVELRQRWTERRHEELDHLRREQHRCKEALQHYTSLWAEGFRRSTYLEQEQRSLAEKTLALEQYRLEFLGQTENSAAAEKRLERLRRRWAALGKTAERRLAHDRRDLERELALLEDRAADLADQAADLEQRWLERSQRRTDEEQEQVHAAVEQARIQHNLHALRLQRDLNQWQLDRLREEVERMALTLIEEPGTPPAAAQAA